MAHLTCRDYLSTYISTPLPRLYQFALNPESYSLGYNVVPMPEIHALARSVFVQQAASPRSEIGKSTP